MNDALFGTPSRATVARRVCSTPIRFKESTSCFANVNEDVGSFLFELDEVVQECDTVLGSSCTVGCDSTVEAVQIEDEIPEALEISTIDHPRYDQCKKNIQTHKNTGTCQVQSRQVQHGDQNRSILQMFNGIGEGGTPGLPCNVHASLYQQELLDSGNSSESLLESCDALEGLLSNISFPFPSFELPHSSDKNGKMAKCMPWTGCQPPPLIKLDVSDDSSDSIIELPQAKFFNRSHSNESVIELPNANFPSSGSRTDIIPRSSPYQHVHHTGTSPVFFMENVASFPDFEDCWPVDVVITDSDSDSSVVVIDQCDDSLPSTLPPPPEKQTSYTPPSTTLFEEQTGDDDLTPTQSTIIGSGECTPKAITHVGSKESPACSVKSTDVLHIDVDEDTIVFVAGSDSASESLEHKSTIISAEPRSRPCTPDEHTVYIGVNFQKHTFSGSNATDTISHYGRKEGMHKPEEVSVPLTVELSSSSLADEVTDKAYPSNQCKRINAPPKEDTNSENVVSCERALSSDTTIATHSNDTWYKATSHKATIPEKDNLAFAGDIHQDPISDGEIVSNTPMIESNLATNVCLGKGEVIDEISDKLLLPNEETSKDHTVHGNVSFLQRPSPKNEGDGKCPERDLRQMINSIRNSCSASLANAHSTKPKAPVMFTVSHQHSLQAISSRRSSVLSRLDVPNVGKAETPGSSTATTKSREPFMSEDPEENKDNENPNWEALRRLTTDEERYKAIRNVWHNARIPDPHCELTTFHYRKRFLCLKDIKNTSAPTQQKRKRTETSDNHERPVKKQRMDTDIFDLKLKELERKKHRDFTAARTTLERELYKLQWNAGQSMAQQQPTPWQSCNSRHHHRTHTVPWDMRYFQQEEQRLQLRYDTDTRIIYDKYSARANRLLHARDEVHRFNQFYVGLGKSDPRVLTEQQIREQLNIEKLLGEFKRQYKSAKD